MLITNLLTSSENQEPNFQKAGTTLDASVKIYGYRVDDTLHTGYRILDNLNRGEQSKQPAEASKPRHKAGNGSEGSSKTTSTIETNLRNIEMDPSDFQFNADPLFHLMSRQFDEGGVKGLLLSNLVERCESSSESRVWIPIVRLCSTPINSSKSEKNHIQIQIQIQRWNQIQIQIQIQSQNWKQRRNLKQNQNRNRSFLRLTRLWTQRS